MPESETPEPPNDEATQASNVQPAQLNDEEYHELADNLINTVYEKAEALLESREDVEVEYSV
jgi:frataxin